MDKLPVYFKEGDVPKINNFIWSWLNMFLKHKSLFEKFEYEKEGEKVIIKKENEIKKIYYIDALGLRLNEIIEEIKKSKIKLNFIVMLNSNENIKKMYENWNVLKQIPYLSLVFVNPLSKTQKKWIITPSTHDSLSEGKIKQGIASISSEVELVDYSYLKQVFED